MRIELYCCNNNFIYLNLCFAILIPLQHKKLLRNDNKSFARTVNPWIPFRKETFVLQAIIVKYDCVLKWFLNNTGIKKIITPVGFYVYDIVARSLSLNITSGLNPTVYIRISYTVMLMVMPEKRNVFILMLIPIAISP